MYRQIAFLIFYKKLFQRFQILAQRQPVTKGMVEGEGLWFLSVISMHTFESLPHVQSFSVFELYRVYVCSTVMML